MDDSRVPIGTEFMEGVVVVFPDKTQDIRAVRRPIPEGIPMERDKSGFKPFRLVMNLKIVDAIDPEKEIHNFVPPIEVRVRILPCDLEQAANEDGTLSLGYWDGSQWIRFSDEHKFHWEPNETPEVNGWGVVSISRWDDPTHAWGT